MGGCIKFPFEAHPKTGPVKNIVFWLSQAIVANRLSLSESQNFLRDVVDRREWE